MKPKIKIATARILALHAEFSPAELAEAYRYLESSSIGQEFGVNLRKHSFFNPETRPNKSSSILVRSKASSDLLNTLEASAPEKYRLLDELDNLLRNNKLAIRLEEIRNIATSINKDQDLGKSKKEAIPKILEALATVPADEIRAHIEHLLRRKNPNNTTDDSYIKLAKFLVRGE